MHRKNLTVDTKQFKSFFTLLWPYQEEGFMAISTDGGNGNGLSTKFFSHPIKEEILLTVLEQWKSYNVWFSIGLFRNKPQHGRGKASDVVGIPGLVADIDCQGGVHNEKNIPTKEEALKLIPEMPFEPSLIIWSGGGFHVYWFFDKPLIFDSPDDREKARELSHRWQRVIVSMGKEKGWKLDSVGSIEHLFRIPGMYNCKADPKLVEIIEKNNLVYSVRRIQEFLDDIPQGQTQDNQRSDGPEIGIVDVLPFSIKNLIKNGVEKGDRSQAIGSVLAAMIRAGVPEDEIIRCFNSEKIGQKYREKGSGKVRWLKAEIQRARDFVEKRPVYEWPEPQAIKKEMLPVEALRESMIPEPLLAMVKDVAHRMSVPSDYVIIPLIILIGSVIGTGCRINPKRKDDWSIVPNLWGGISGPPSRLKTPAMDEVIKKLLGRLEFEASEKNAREKAKWTRTEKTRKMKTDVLNAEFKKTYKNEREDAQAIKKSSEILEEIDLLKDAACPSERRYKVNDASIEKIVELLSNNAPRGLLYHRDELIGLFKKMDKPGHEQDRAFLIESWNGNGGHTDDRIGRGTTKAENLCISLVGTIQPGRLVAYLRDALSQNANDGFPQRLQLMVYPDDKPFKYVDEWPDKEAKNRVFKIVKGLAHETFEGGEFEDDDPSALFEVF